MGAEWKSGEEGPLLDLNPLSTDQEEEAQAQRQQGGAYSVSSSSSSSASESESESESDSDLEQSEEGEVDGYFTVLHLNPPGTAKAAKVSPGRQEKVIDLDLPKLRQLVQAGKAAQAHKEIQNAVRRYWLTEQAISYGDS